MLRQIWKYNFFGRNLVLNPPNQGLFTVTWDQGFFLPTVTLDQKLVIPTQTNVQKMILLPKLWIKIWSLQL